MNIEISGHDRIAFELEAFPRRAQKIIVRALNRGIDSARTAMVREIATDTGLKSKDVRDALSLQHANFETPEARLGARLKRLPLIAFGARGPEPSRGKGRGVSYRLGTGGRGRVENAFIATMRSGHRGVFKRTGKKRLPIQELFGPSLGHVFGKYRAVGRARAEEVFMTNLTHDLDRALGRTASTTGTDAGTD